MGGDDRDQRMWRALWEELDARRVELDACVEEAARRIPAFVPLLEGMSPELREQQRIHSVEIQRAAMLDGKWDAYVADLQGQGKVYAQMGIPFADWYPLLGAFRGVFMRDVIELPAERARLVIEGMDRFLDLAMSTIGGAYVEMQAELAARAQSRLQLYIDIVKHAPLGMLKFRWAGPNSPEPLQLVTANPAALRLGGPSLAAFDGAPLDPKWAELSGLAEHAAIVATTRAPQTWKRSTAFPGTIGRTYEFHCFRLAEGHFGLIFEDVSEQERLHQQIREQLRELERSNRELDDFAYVASHDLKAPLQDVRNLADWIAEDIGAALPERSTRHVALLGDRVRRMERLLDDLLEYSRIGRADGPHEQVSLRDVMAEVVALVHPPPGFRVELQGDSPVISTPRAALEKVLRNLVGNAIKHHDRATGSVVVTARDEGARMSIRVTDDGPGIPAEFQTRVFAMFQTLRPRDEVEGSGMGLTFVKKAVEIHDGEVHIESMGRGTTVVFDWPLAAGVPDTGGAA
jgi:signal transduction histidine kinase